MKQVAKIALPQNFTSWLGDSQLEGNLQIWSFSLGEQRVILHIKHPNFLRLAPKKGTPETSDLKTNEAHKTQTLEAKGEMSKCLSVDSLNPRSGEEQPLVHKTYLKVIHLVTLGALV